MRQNLEYGLASDVLSKALDSIGHGVLVCDLEGMILFANPAWLLTSGYSAGEMIGMPLSRLFLEDDQDLLYRNLMHLARSGEGFEGELKLLKKDGSSFFAQLTLDTCPQADQGCEVTILGIKDIDRQKQLEKVLEKSNHAELVSIADSIAHELRNPLMGIGGFVKRMYNSCRAGAEQHQYYAYINDNLRRIEDLVKQIGDLVGLPSPEYGNESLPDLVEQSLACFGQEIQLRGIVLKSEVEDLRIRIDGRMIAKCLTILVGNALEAMRDGGCIQVRGVQTGQSCLLEVQDDGYGMSAAIKPLIFNPFFSTKADGVGMELALVKRMVEMHQGIIRVESQEGQGSTFRMELPLERRRAIRTRAFDGQPERAQVLHS